MEVTNCEEMIKGNINVEDKGTSGNRRGSNDLYSPMRKAERKIEHVDNIASVLVNHNKMINKDSLILKESDPDYESVEFPDENSLKNPLFSELLCDNFRNIDNNSELDFSTHKRNLVLGIDRKPEIKPLPIFKIEVNEIEKIQFTSSEIEKSV